MNLDRDHPRRQAVAAAGGGRGRLAPRLRLPHEAGVAAARDASAAYYNPAALALTTGTDLLFMHRIWIQGARMEYAAVSTKLSNVVLGAHLNNVSVDDIEVRSVPGPAAAESRLTGQLSARYRGKRTRAAGRSGHPGRSAENRIVFDRRCYR